jgi:type VI secretion system secreted protein VgrG
VKEELPDPGRDTLVAENPSPAAFGLQQATQAVQATDTAAQLAGASPEVLSQTARLQQAAQVAGALQSPTQFSASDLSTSTLPMSSTPGFNPGAGAGSMLDNAWDAAQLGSMVSPELAQVTRAAQLVQSATGLASSLASGAAAGGAAMDAAAVSTSTLPMATPPVAGSPVGSFTAVNEAEARVYEPPAQVEDAALQIPVYDLLAEYTPPRFEDNNRLFCLYTLLPEDKRLYVDTLGGNEGLSEPFEFHLRLASLNAGIELKELMSKPVTVGVLQTDGSRRYVHGYIKSFAFDRTDGGWAYYLAHVVPWTSFLTLRQECRIFQDKTIPQVLEEVFGEYGSAADFELRLSHGYQPENFIVQYQQTDWQFVSQLMEQEGMTYFYEHRLDGHKLIVTDDTLVPSYCPPLPVYAQLEFNGGDRVTELNCVDDLHAVRELQPGKHTVDTYDFKAPRGHRLAEVPTVANQGEVPKLEVYDGTPGHAYRSQAEGERYARLRMEEYESRAKRFYGSSDCPDLRAGHSTVLTHHHWFDARNPDADRLLITRVEHHGRNNIVAGTEASYRNQFECQRQRVPYRPPLVHPRPRIEGVQTATVTGPKGEEIWTDPFGRIKVRFHWDRRAPFDERSSCWMRVMQPWAGRGWGTVSIPRIGQEVIVAFLDGNPSRPIVMGSVYNGDMPLPYALPDGAHMMGFKSNSTPGGGGFSEMVIHDRAGQELINIHSQKDMVTTVQHTQATVVNGPHQTTSVTKGFKQTTVKQHIKVQSEDSEIEVEAKTKITLICGKSKLTMDAEGNITIEGKVIHSIATDDHVVKGSKLHLNPPG